MVIGPVIYEWYVFIGPDMYICYVFIGPDMNICYVCMVSRKVKLNMFHMHGHFTFTSMDE